MFPGRRGQLEAPRDQLGLAVLAETQPCHGAGPCRQRRSYVILGSVYADGGYGVARDYVEARKWWLKAAEGGNVDAAYVLGRFAQDGTGQARDLSAARRWYTKAAEAGNAKSQFNLALMSVRGQGGPQDYAAAVRWFRQASARGYADATYNMGVLYQNGWGVPTDAYEARQWYVKAAHQGSGAARQVLAQGTGSGRRSGSGGNVFGTMFWNKVSGTSAMNFMSPCN